MDTTNTATYLVPEEKLSELTTKLDKLSRKAARLAVTAITYTVGEVQTLPFAVYRSQDSLSKTRLDPVADAARIAFLEKKTAQDPLSTEKIAYLRVFPVTVTGTTPRLAGWDFVGTLQHIQGEDGEMAVITRTVPAFEGKLPEKFRDATPENCDHCHKAIKTRKDTYVVVNEAGEFKQVGRNCTQDFLGGKDPQGLASAMEAIYEAFRTGGDYEGGFGGRGLTNDSLVGFMTATATIIRKFGWVSRKNAELYCKEATVDTVNYLLNPPSFGTEAYDHWRRFAEDCRATAEDTETAEKALEWARSFGEKDPRSDYEHNLYVATLGKALAPRTGGLVASAVGSYLRHVGELVARAKLGDSKHFGEVGKRADFYVTATKVSTSEGQFGTTFIYKLVTRDGNAATWFSSRSVDELKIGEEVRVTATVKKHSDFKGVKETVLTRVTVYSAEGRAEAEEKEARKAAREARKAARNAQV